ncbi:hypothetical protein [Paenibacillus swuensis]|uniref:hypothetical protein n=1 Tax=Paenibacillus swuensis TaxID=1178515 RepID=UPI000A472EAF|nr:hypothetical protein [Paenibacillus swuensis]
MLHGLMEKGIAELETSIGQKIDGQKITELMVRPITFVLSQLVRFEEEAKMKEDSI